MRKRKSKNSKCGGRAPTTVQLEFIHPTASTVRIAGTFNDWRPEVTPMESLGRGRWIRKLALAPGVYEYRLVVDGRWIIDPEADSYSLDGSGNLNSVLTVESC
jgi:1,4-alpha-glucan branching enzyme